MAQYPRLQDEVDKRSGEAQTCPGATAGSAILGGVWAGASEGHVPGPFGVAFWEMLRNIWGNSLGVVNWVTHGNKSSYIYSVYNWDTLN